VIVSSSEATPYAMTQKALESELGKHGHISQVISLAELRDKTMSIVPSEAKVVIAVGTQAATWLHPQVKPPQHLVYCMVSDPIEAGLHKEPLITGVSTQVPIKGQFQLIQEALPKVRTLGMLYHTTTDKEKSLLKSIREQLPEGWRLEAVAIDQYKTVAQAIAELFGRKIDIIWTEPDALIYKRATVRTLLLTALRKNVPVFGYSAGFVKAGGLLGIAIDPDTQARQAIDIVERFLHEENPSTGTHNSETQENWQKARYEIALNLIVAEQLSITFPQELLKRAKYVFKPQGNNDKEKSK